MIVATNLTKTYGDNTVVNNVSFKVADGETLVLVGASGSGKTTILKMINRLIEADSGEVTIGTRSTNKMDQTELRRSIGYVFQDIGLFPHYTVRENMSTVPRLLKWPEAKIQDRNKELLKLLNLDTEFLDRYPFELSGGQQQRVGLARALAADPRIMLMDEPFGALDPITKKQIRKEFKKIESIISKTVMLVTHDVVEAFELGDRICIISGGRILQEGTPEEILSNPLDENVSSLLKQDTMTLKMAAINIFDILKHLPVIKSVTENIKEIPSTFTLLDILEEFNNPEVDYLKITDNEKDIVFSEVSLMKSFLKSQIEKYDS